MNINKVFLPLLFFGGLLGCSFLLVAKTPASHLTSYEYVCATVTDRIHHSDSGFMGSSAHWMVVLEVENTNVQLWHQDEVPQFDVGDNILLQVGSNDFLFSETWYEWIWPPRSC